MFWKDRLAVQIVQINLYLILAKDNVFSVQQTLNLIKLPINVFLMFNAHMAMSTVTRLKNVNALVQILTLMENNVFLASYPTIGIQQVQNVWAALLDQSITYKLYNVNNALFKLQIQLE